MILRIARKESIERLRDGQFRIVSLIVLLLLLCALMIGYTRYSKVHGQREAAQKKDREQWLNQGTRNPHSAAHYGMYAFKPRLPLSFVDEGMEPYTGSAVWIEAHYQNPIDFRPAEDRTALQRFGELTAAATLQWLLPVVITMLTFASVTSEKEYGTLRQLVGLGIPREKILLGKALGAAGALAVLIIPATILGAAALAFAGDQTTGARALPTAIAYAVYLLLFIALSLAVSAVSSSSRISLAVLLGIWATSSFLIPRLAGDAAERFHPIPAAEDFWRVITEETRGGDGHSANDSRTLELKRVVMAKYGVGRVEDLPVNFEGLRLQTGEEHGNEVFDRHFGDLWIIYEQQERVHHWASILSPLIAVRSISMAMAGTDLAHLRDFTNAAEQYRRIVNRKMNLNVANNSRTGQYYYFVDRKLWTDTPDFTYRPPDALWAMRRQWLPASILTAWFAAAVCAAFLLVRRMRLA